MYDFHSDKKQYVEIQLRNAEKYVLPFIDSIYPLAGDMHVLEIGSGKGSLLKAFVNRGCRAVGVEMNAEFVDYARSWLQEDETSGNIRFICKDIYKVDLQAELGGELFDLVIMKDVIEHIHDQEKLIGFLKSLLKPGGMIFIAFPPWYMPFGGHQQICRNALLSKLPYYHLLPGPVYKALLKRFHEPVEALMEIKETGISIERFERLCKKTGYSIVADRHFLVNPVYEFKFGLKPRKQAGVIRAIPYVRDFLTTCVYYIIKPVI